jgi:hypothetical protein
MRFGSDVRYMAKAASTILILCRGKSVDWTSDRDARMVQWCLQMIKGLQKSSLRQLEAATTK